MVDYLAVERADAEIAGEIGVGLARGAELAGIEIVGGELAQLGELIRGLDLAGACVGVVDLDAMVTGAAIEPGDVADRAALIGAALERLHARPRGAGRDPARRRAARPPARRRAARADRDLRQGGDGPAALEGARARPRPPDLGRARQPAAARGGRRLPRRFAAAGASGLRPDRGARRGPATRRCTTSSTWAAASAASSTPCTRPTPSRYCGCTTPAPRGSARSPTGPARSPGPERGDPRRQGERGFGRSA